MPVVVVRQSSQRGLDARNHHRHIGEELLEDVGIDDGGVVGPLSGACVGGVGIVAATATVGGVVVHHRVHGAGAHTEEQTRAAQLAEVAQVVAPVGLRHDGHAIALRLEHAPDDRRAHRGVVDIGVASE